MCYLGFSVHGHHAPFPSWFRAAVSLRVQWPHLLEGWRSGRRVWAGVWDGEIDTQDSSAALSSIPS